MRFSSGVLLAMIGASKANKAYGKANLRATLSHSSSERVEQSGGKSLRRRLQSNLISDSTGVTINSGQSNSIDSSVTVEIAGDGNRVQSSREVTISGTSNSVDTSGLVTINGCSNFVNSGFANSIENGSNNVDITGGGNVLIISSEVTVTGDANAAVVTNDSTISGTFNKIIGAEDAIVTGDNNQVVPVVFTSPLDTTISTSSVSLIGNDNVVINQGGVSTSQQAVGTSFTDIEGDTNLIINESGLEGGPAIIDGENNAIFNGEKNEIIGDGNLILDLDSLDSEDLSFDIDAALSEAQSGARPSGFEKPVNPSTGNFIGGNGNIVGGEGNTLRGSEDARVDGAGNSIFGGTLNIITGEGNTIGLFTTYEDDRGNRIIGDGNSVVGDFNGVFGDGNEVTGSGNLVFGDNQVVNGDNEVVGTQPNDFDPTGLGRGSVSIPSPLEVTDTGFQGLGVSSVFSIGGGDGGSGGGGFAQQDVVIPVELSLPLPEGTLPEEETLPSEETLPPVGIDTAEAEEGNGFVGFGVAGVGRIRSFLDSFSNGQDVILRSRLP